MDLDLTASTRELAGAAADLVRLLPGRLLDPVLAGVVLEATPETVTLAGTDRERSIQLSRSARTHTEGRVLVPARPLADTLRSLDAPEVRLLVEGNKLALRTPRARFALPLLDIGTHPGVRCAPPIVGSLNAVLLRRAAVAASAASRDDALPVFTGVHLGQRTDGLTFVGTDRFRMAIVTVPGMSLAGEALVPATLLAEVAKQAPETAEVTLHLDTDRVGFGWPGTRVSTSVLDAPFPDESRHVRAAPDCSVDVGSEELGSSVRRIAPYAGGHGAVHLDVGDGEIRIRASDPQIGDAEETVKAAVDGDRLTLAFQPRYLTDALQAFAGRPVRLALRAGHRKASVFTDAEPDPAGTQLHYVVMPKTL